VTAGTVHQVKPNGASAAPRWQLPSAISIVTPAGLTRLPLAVVLAYVVATFVLFLTWPIDWPIYTLANWIRLVGYVSLCLVVLGVGAFKGSSGPTRVVAPLPYLGVWLPLGAVAAALLLIPSSVVYTGLHPWDIMEALKDQAAAYRRLQQQLFLTSGERDNIVAMRAAIAPLTYAILPLGIIRWKSIGWLGRGSVIVIVATSLIFSILRGTDKELADLFLVGIAAGFVLVGRMIALGKGGSELVRRSWVLAAIAIVFLIFAQGLFTQRKQERLGGRVSRTSVCANSSRICADLDNPLIAWLPAKQRFGITVFILSTCSGYYGLELAMEKPFDTSFGLGHSPATLSVYEAVTGDPTLHKRTYTYRNGADGWSEEYYWSTLIAWIANDVGFLGAVFVLALIGFMWGKWWREAAAGMSDPAAVLFALSTTAIFYLPANNQVLASYDGYTIFAVWIAIWLWHRSRRALFMVMPREPAGSA
jgi:hypothetical protein